MRFKILSFLTLYFTLCMAAGWAHDSGRNQTIEELKGLKAKNTQLLQELDQKLNKQLSPATISTSGAVQVPHLNEDEIEKISEERQEGLLRQELIDRLLLQVDSKFKGGDLRLFLVARLNEMARIDLLNSPGQQKLWKLMSYLSQALHNLPERGDNIVAFIDGYLQRSKFKKPLKPEEYLLSRQYSNGRDSVAATPATREQVGEQLESRLNELDKATPKAPTAVEPLTNSL